MKAEKDVEGLIKALKDKDESVRWRGHVALGEIGEPAVEPLIQALRRDNDRGVREIAAKALGDIGDVRAVESLKRALWDGEYWVQERASEALKKIEAKKKRK